MNEEELLKQHSRIINRQAHRAHNYLRCHCEFDDVVQHARLAALRAIRTYDPKRGLALRTWVYWVVSRSMSTLCRRTRWYCEVAVDQLVETSAPDAEFGKAEHLALVRSLVEELPKLERVVARLVFVDGMSLAEAGAWISADRTEAMRLYRRAVRWFAREWQASDLLPEHLV